MTCAYLLKRSQKMEFSTDKAPYPYRDQLYPEPMQTPSRSIPESVDRDIQSSSGVENVPVLGDIQMPNIPNLEKHLLNAQKALSDTRIFSCESTSTTNEPVTSDVKILEELPKEEDSDVKLDVMDLFGKADRDERIKPVETDWSKSLSRPKPVVSRPTATVPPQRSSPTRQSPGRPKRKGPVAGVRESAHNTPPPIRFQIASSRNQAAPPLVRSALDAEDSDSDTDESQEDIRMTSSGTESQRESRGRSREDSESQVSATRSSRSNSRSGSSSREIPRSVTPDPDIAEMFGSQDVDLRNPDFDIRSLDDSQSSNQDVDFGLRDVDMRVQSRRQNNVTGLTNVMSQSGVPSSVHPTSGPPPLGGPPTIPTPDLSLPPPPLVRPLLTRPTVPLPSIPPPSVPPSGAHNMPPIAAPRNLPPHPMRLPTPPPPLNPLVSNPALTHTPPQSLLSSIPVISQTISAPSINPAVNLPPNIMSSFSRPPPSIGTAISNIQGNGPSGQGQFPSHQQIPLNQSTFHRPMRNPSPIGSDAGPTLQIPSAAIQTMRLPDLSREPPLLGRASSPVWAPPSTQQRTSPMPQFPHSNQIGDPPPQRTSPVMFPMSSQERPPLSHQRSSPLHFLHDNTRGFQPIPLHPGEQRFDAYRPNFSQGPSESLQNTHRSSSPSHIPVHHPTPQSSMGRAPSPDLYRQNNSGRQNLKPITPVESYNNTPKIQVPSDAANEAVNNTKDKNADVHEEYVPTSPTCASPEPGNEITYIPTSKAITDRRSSDMSNTRDSTNSSPEITSSQKGVSEKEGTSPQDNTKDAVQESIAGEQSKAASKVTKRKAGFDMFDFGEDESKKKKDKIEEKSPSQAKVAKIEEKSETAQKYDEEVLLEKVRRSTAHL